MRLRCIYCGLYTVFYGLLLASSVAFADDEPPSIGNYALPYSQQMGPLFSFGQNLLGAKIAQIYTSPFYTQVHHGHLGAEISSLLYGIRDDLAFVFLLPYAVEFRERLDHSSGLQDSIISLEYGYYFKSTKTYTEGASILGFITLPSGDELKVPETGIGTTGYFLGGTYYRSYNYWYGFVDGGYYWTTVNDENVRTGSSTFYQGGIGRNISAEYHKYILGWVVELDGQFTNKDKRFSVADPNTGGHTLFLGPSLWFSTMTFILQFGVGIPIYQQLNGDQDKDLYVLALSLGWTIS